MVSEQQKSVDVSYILEILPQIYSNVFIRSYLYFVRKNGHICHYTQFSGGSTKEGNIINKISPRVFEQKKSVDVALILKISIPIQPRQFFLSISYFFPKIVICQFMLHFRKVVPKKNTFNITFYQGSPSKRNLQTLHISLEYWLKYNLYNFWA